MKGLLQFFLICLVAGSLSLPGAALCAGSDTLFIGVSSDIHTLDFSVSSDNFDWRQIYPCYDRLVKYKTIDGKGSTEVEPMAAESWTVSDDGMVWGFKIRKGITFEDGTALDAAAVKFSFDRTLIIAKGPADNISAIKSMRVVDPYTLEVTLKTPFGPFLQTLASNAACIVNPAVIKHEENGDLAQAWLSEHVMGSGPFKLTEWTRGKRAVLEARPGYWGGTPKLKKVVVCFMPDASERRTALEQGKIDIAEGIHMDQIPALEKNPDIDVQKHASQQVEYVYLNNRKPMLKKADIRQALCYAVNYKGIIDDVLLGNGVQMRGPVPKGMWGHKDDLFQHSRDLDKARALLKKAGAKNLTLTLIYSTRRAFWEQIATILQQNFADIGVTLKLEVLPNPILRERVDRGDFELCMGAWSPDFADPYMFMNVFFDSDRWGLPGNRSFYKNRKVDKLIRASAAANDQAKRTELYDEAQKIIMKDAPYIFLYQVKTIVPLKKNVKGYVFNPMLESMYNMAAIWKE